MLFHMSVPVRVMIQLGVEGCTADIEGVNIGWVRILCGWLEEGRITTSAKWIRGLMCMDVMWSW